MSQPGDGAQPLVLPLNTKAPKNGYAYIYLSNENDDAVYFDNFTVSDNRGRIIEEDHYYAFGLKIAGISSKKLGDVNEGLLDNKNLYNDKELLDDADLDLYDYGYRNYDPQIGRFTQLDPLTDYYPDLTPYQYASDEPIANVDMDGLEKATSIAKDFAYDYGSKATPTFNFIIDQGVKAAVSDATKLKPLFKLASIIPAAIKTAGQITNIVLNNKFELQKVRVGLDWQGKGALPLPAQSLNNKKNNSETKLKKSLETGGQLAETGMYMSTLIQKNSVAKKFEAAGNIIRGVEIINNLSNNDYSGLTLNIIDYGISKTPLAPYYYGAKATYEIYNSDYMQSAGYQEALQEERTAYYLLNQSEPGNFDYKFLERQAKQASDARKAYEDKWLSSHSDE